MMMLQVTIKGKLPVELEGLTETEIKEKLIADGAYSPAALQSVQLIEEN